MNRLTTQISAICLCMALAPASHALGKKKKQVDLSANPLSGVKSQQPDKVLFDKAMAALKKGKYDVARLDLQTLLNTYGDSDYSMRAKLAIGDTWYKEGGSAALTQAESEYKDFITFFPNTPEAAEAQMKVGDIYYEQMEKPDRDPQNVIHAEQEYRTMIEQFPDSPLIPRAKQRLRDVQEVLAQRQFEIGQFYATHENWAATIARLQTVADTYPLFSHSDDTLITIGDAYANEAQIANRMNLPPKAKAQLVKTYNDQARAAWDRVVTHYAMSPHVEDAKDRLIAMGMPVPEPTQQQLAESEAEEGSRTNVRLKDRAMLLIKHGPSTVEAARVGEPTLTDPPPVLAPQVNKQTLAAFNAAIKGKPIPPMSTSYTETENAKAAPAPGSQGTGQSSQPLEMQPVTESSGASGNDTSVEIVNPGSSSSPDSGSGNNAPPTSDTGAAADHSNPGDNNPNPANSENPEAKYGLNQPVAPANNKALPAVDKPAEAPDQINDVKGGGGGHAQVQTGATATNKKKSAPYHADKESSSRHKKKTGLDKLNPF